MSAKLYMTPNGKVPLQGGKPVFIRYGEFYDCCCAENMPPPPDPPQCVETCRIRSFNEHLEALGQSASVCPSDSNIQAWLEGSYSSFVDHVSGPLAADEKSFLMFTKQAWATEAGLTLDGSDNVVWGDEWDIVEGLNA